MTVQLIRYTILIPEWELENIAEILSDAHLTYLELNTESVKVVKVK